MWALRVALILLPGALCGAFAPLQPVGELAYPRDLCAADRTARGKIAQGARAGASSTLRMGDFACDTLPVSAVLPSLVVFDLDNTLWTPELYQLRKLPGYNDASGPGPVADKDVKLFAGAKDALLELATAERWKGTSVAAASRTNKGPWAKSLLQQFEINGQPLNELIPYQEIYSSDKTRHFEALRKQTGCAFEDMLFFDDAKAGRYGNCEPVAKLGVMSAHCPHGLTTKVWANALEEFAAAKAAGGGVRMGRVLNAPADDSAVSAGKHTATIAVWKEDKAFGFVKLEDKSEVFFHRSAVGTGVVLARGSKVQVTVGQGRDGKTSCTSVTAVGGAGASQGGDDGAQTIEIDCFSMNQAPLSIACARMCAPSMSTSKRVSMSSSIPMCSLYLSVAMVTAFCISPLLGWWRTDSRRSRPATLRSSRSWLGAGFASTSGSARIPTVLLTPYPINTLPIPIPPPSLYILDPQH